MNQQDTPIVKNLIESIPLLAKVSRFEYLDRGYSDDRKYVLWEDEAPRYLLRLSGANDGSHRKKAFDIMTRLHDG